ncbi:MAG TPA: electron transfer flavoprotein subunit beta, partial [Lachnospiraceae bacterium]|nr:electron transfer flavoprotein subunit beta [Lachnospiraceae bacterium]
AIDGDTAQVGPQIAEHLGIPHVSYAASVEVEDDDTVVIRRNFEDRYHIIEAKTPLLITTLGEEIEPRYMSVGGIFDAYREKEVKVWGYDDLQGCVDDSNLGLKGSPTQVKKSFTKPVKPAGTLYQEVSADEAVEIIVNKLKEKYII